MKIVLKLTAPHFVGVEEYRVVYDHVVGIIESAPRDADCRGLAVESLRELELAAASMADTIECSPNNLTLATSE